MKVLLHRKIVYALRLFINILMLTVLLLGRYTFAKFTKDRRREGFDDYLRILATLKPPPPELLHFLGLASNGGDDNGHSSSDGQRDSSKGLRRRRVGDNEGNSGNDKEGSGSGHGASTQRHQPSSSHAPDLSDEQNSKSSREGASSSSSTSALKSSAALVAGAGAGLVAFLLRAWQGGQPLFEPMRLLGGLFSSSTSGNVGASGGWGPCVAVLAAWGVFYHTFLLYG